MSKIDRSSDYKWAIGGSVVETAKLESAITDLIAFARKWAYCRRLCSCTLGAPSRIHKNKWVE